MHVTTPMLATNVFKGQLSALQQTRDKTADPLQFMAQDV